MMLHEIVDRAARRVADAPALVFGDRTWTFADLQDRVSRLAAGLERFTAPGDRVAILAENSPVFVECLYGVPRAGCVATLLNYRLHPEEWVALLARSETAVLVGERALLDALDPFVEHLPSIETVVCIDDPRPEHRPYEDLLATSAPGAPARSRSPSDVSWLIFTSGTTGAPKGAMLTHASIEAAIRTTELARPTRDDDVYLFPFPLCHIAAYNVLVMHARGVPVVLMRRFDAGEVLRVAARSGVTTMSLAPTMLDMVLHHPDISTADVTSVRGISYGASAIPTPVLRGAAERFGCEFSQGYGMTELSGNAVFLDAAAHRRALDGEDRLLAAAGKPSPLAEVRVVDDAFRDVPIGEIGEIVVRGEQVMAGYWRDPETTAAAIVDGWLRTGDVGRFDDEGFLYVVDRKKDVIVTGGENVASREVEDVLRRDVRVRDVAIVGIPDERWGERVCAVVVTRDGETIDPDQLVELVGSHLAGFKKPRDFVFVDALPVNASGKVRKQQLRAELAARFGSRSGEASFGQLE